MSTSSNSPEGAQSGGTSSSFQAEWPLKFRAHYFLGACYSTYGCRIHYGHYYPGDNPDDVLAISSESVANYPDNLNASWGPFPNFPPEAKVTWRSKDGTSHEAKIDIGEIFKEQLVFHKVAREDAAENANDGLPGIILEVNDRTINVYMRATIWLKKPRFPERPLSNSQRDLIKVFSRTY
jgi:hypothetical protein